MSEVAEVEAGNVAVDEQITAGGVDPAVEGGDATAVTDVVVGESDEGGDAVGDNVVEAIAEEPASAELDLDALLQSGVAVLDYSPIELPMSFGTALTMLKQGQKMCRRQWRDESGAQDAYIEMRTGTLSAEQFPFGATHVNGIAANLFSASSLGVVVPPEIVVVENGVLLEGVCLADFDLLAEDWMFFQGQEAPEAAIQGAV